MTDEKIANRTAVALGNFDGMHVGHMEATSPNNQGRLMG
mgnify:CR=1 FL=1